MSRHIEDVLKILEEMRRQFSGNSGLPAVGKLRHSATETVAKNSNRTQTTVHDAITRRLNLKADETDQLLRAWLRNEPTGLKNAIEKHSQKKGTRKT